MDKTRSMELIPVKQHLHENAVFSGNPDCLETLDMTVDFFNRVGYNPPWIGYFAQLNGELVGAAAFKGKPVNNKVEIAYGTFPRFRNQGIGKRIADALVQLSLQTDPSVIITARTLPEENYSVRILRKNNFRLAGTITDPDDGDVWEWVYGRHL
ncbi:MAG TPA: GNAT family protein [Mucilaginibacter sp.]|nr:GNAT family protein [Mucilaginibacter sp.]